MLTSFLSVMFAARQFLLGGSPSLWPGARPGWLLGVFLVLTGPGHALAEEPASGALGEEVFLSVPPVSTSLFSQGRPAGVLTVTLQLQILEADKRAAAQKQMPRLSDAYLRETTRLALEYLDIDRPVNVALLTRLYQKATDRLLQHREAKVLISNVAVQKR